MLSSSKPVAVSPAYLPRLPRAAAFWSVAGVLGVVLGGSAVVSPLYGVYQASWHFSATSLTTVFAVYALALLAVLLVAGSLSDHIGRRPMMAIALAAEAGAAGLFLAASGLAELYGARVLQGVATGVAASTVGAALLELQPAHRPALGATVNSSASTAALAAAALGSSAVIQYGPAPTRLVFWLLLAASIAGMAVLALVPESGTRRPVRLGVLRPRAGVPSAARRAFAAALPALVASWALGGLYFSLGPSLAENLAHSADVVWGGLVIFLLAGSGSAASVLLRTWPAQAAMIAGGAGLAAGSAGTVAAIVTGSTAGFLAGSAAAGLGFGASFLGSFRRLAALASPAERGTLIATVYVVSYLAFSLPAIAAGIATTRLGLDETAIVYGAGVSLLAVLAAVASAATAQGRVTATRSAACGRDR